jgi:hypothetical protein
MREPHASFRRRLLLWAMIPPSRFGAGRWLPLKLGPLKGAVLISISLRAAFLAGLPLACMADITPPTVTLTSPADGIVVSDTITLAANASASTGVAKVEFYMDRSHFLGAATSAPFNYTCDTRTMERGSHLFYCVAFDAAGNSGRSRTAQVMLLPVTSTNGGFISQRGGPTHSNGQGLNASEAGDRGCTCILSPTSASFPLNGGSGALSVIAPAGCAWTAISSASWLTITAGAGGTGNGSVSYSVAPNETPQCPERQPHHRRPDLHRDRSRRSYPHLCAEGFGRADTGNHS